MNDYTMPMLITVCILAIIYSVIAGVYSEKEWQIFKSQHDCVIVGKVESTINPGFSTDGQFIATTTPSQTGWECNDGVTYWR